MPNCCLSRPCYTDREMRRLGLLERKAAQRDVGKRDIELSLNMKKPTIFLSHSHPDKKFVRELAQKLEKSGINVYCSMHP